MNRPNIYDYENYRMYLGDWYAWMKETKQGFSYRTFSKWAGFQSPNQLQLVIQGKRNITPSTIGIFAKILKLKRREKRFFELLVKQNQADSPELKAQCLLEILNFYKKYKNNIKENQYDYLTKWYYPVLRELVTTKDFRLDRRYIAKRVGHNVTPINVDEAFEKLITLGLLSRKEDKKFVQSEAVITTGEETLSAASYFYHDQMIRLGHNALKTQLPHDRNFSGITFACRKEDITEIVQMINDCRHEILSYLEEHAKSYNNDEVYQLNVQLFRVTKERRET